MVGTARALGIDLDGRALRVVFGLGQLPFRPPDVAGWPSNEEWLSTAAALVRLEWAIAIAAEVDPEAVDLRDGGADTLAGVLGVEGWPDHTAAVLESARDPRQALALAIAAPEHLVS